jgi:hypothetical protein
MRTPSNQAIQRGHEQRIHGNRGVNRSRSLGRPGFSRAAVIACCSWETEIRPVEPLAVYASGIPNEAIPPDPVWTVQGSTVLNVASEISTRKA